MKTRKTVMILVVLIGLLGFSAVVMAGDLQPPGAPGSTMKTLDEVEPRIPIPGSDTPVGPLNITKSGSYYLTGDRNASRTGINVLADNVTIDMKGYSLIGLGSGTYNGIIIGMAGGANVEIRNGTVRNFGGAGISEASSAGQNHRVIAVRVVSNGLSGIYLNGNGHLVKDCTASDNGDSATSTVYGIYTGSGSTVTGNTVYGNGESASGGVAGIFTESGCTVAGNTSYGNGNSSTAGSAMGIYAGSGSTVTGNTVHSNGISATSLVWGIYLGGYNLVDQNTASNNSGINMTLGVAGCVYGNNVAP